MVNLDEKIEEISDECVLFLRHKLIKGVSTKYITDKLGINLIGDEKKCKILIDEINKKTNDKYKDKMYVNKKNGISKDLYSFYIDYFL